MVKTTILYENVQKIDHKTLWSKIEPYITKSKDDVTNKKKKYDYYIYEMIRKDRNYNNHQANIVFSYVQKFVNKYTTNITINSYATDIPHFIVYFTVNEKSKKIKMTMNDLWSNMIFPKISNTHPHLNVVKDNFYFMDRKIRRLYSRYTSGSVDARFLKNRRISHLEMLNIMISDAGVGDIRVTGFKPRGTDIYYVVKNI